MGSSLNDDDGVTFWVRGLIVIISHMKRDTFECHKAANCVICFGIYPLSWSRISPTVSVFSQVVSDAITCSARGVHGWFRAAGIE